MNSQNLSCKLLTIASLIISIFSASLSGYLFWRLTQIETNLAKITTKDRLKDTSINQNSQIETKQNIPPLDRESAPK